MLLSLSCSARQRSALSRSKKERTEKQTACLQGGEAPPHSLSLANCLRKFSLSVKLHLFWSNSIYRSVAEKPYLHMRGFCVRYTGSTAISCDTPKATTALSEKRKKNNAALNADCNNLHFFLTKLCDVIKKEAAIAFSFSPVFNKQKMSFPLSDANVTNSVLCDFCQRHQMSLLI